MLGLTLIDVQFLQMKIKVLGVQKWKGEEEFMVRRRIWIFSLALMVAGVLAAPTVNVDAAGLTQAADESQVQYGKLSDADRALLMQLFDAEYYLQQNPDLAAKYAGDIEGLFNHFCLLGIFEGRTCNADFDPAAYASAYDDLSAAFGADIVKYYEHYLTDGKANGRNITTVAECAANGITVQSLAAPEVSITPATYKIATIMGTTDIAAVQQAVDRAVAQAYSSSSSSGSSSSSSSDSAVAITNGETTVVLVPEDSYDAIYQEASGLQHAGTMTIDSASGSGLFHILIYKNNTGNGYAAYTTDETDWSMPPVTQIATIGAFAGLDDSNKIGQVTVNGLHASNSDIEEWESASPIPTNGTFVNAEWESFSESGTNEKESTGEKIDYSVTYNEGTEYEMTFENSTYHDEEGGLGSEYEVGFKFTESSEDSVSFEVGVYNEDTGFALVDESTDTPEEE